VSEQSAVSSERNMTRRISMIIEASLRQTATVLFPLTADR
jgi:hypothetical protein